MEKTGIESRAIAGNDECASDLGTRAAKKIFDSGKWKPADIDFLLFCTQSPDYFLPTTACKIHRDLGLSPHCGALDFNLGCSGFIYGLSLAKGLIAGGIAQRVLLITADTYSKYIHPLDKSVRAIFGDGAAATLIGASEESGIEEFVLGTDGTGIPNLIVPAGGQRIPCTPNTAQEHTDASGNTRSQNHLYMSGGEIFNFTIAAVPQLLTEVLKKNNKTMEKIDYFVFHQANRYMLEHLRKKSGIPSEKFCINMKDYGNTVSASIPMALQAAIIDKLIHLSDTICLIGFGVGYSWGGVTIRLTEEVTCT